jgi:hypothetical protein
LHTQFLQSRTCRLFGVMSHEDQGLWEALQLELPCPRFGSCRMHEAESPKMVQQQTLLSHPALRNPAGNLIHFA